MKFSDRVGRIDIDTTHLKTFLNVWCEPEDIVAVVGIPSNGVRRVMSFPITAKELAEQTEETLEKELCVISSTGAKIDLYLQMNPVKSADAVSLFSPGKKEDIKLIRGCFIDLDIGKQDAFESKDQIHEFLSSLPVYPTMVVDNGISGGVHAYWRFTEGVDHTKSEDASHVLEAWWCFISEQAESFLGRRIIIDRLIDVTRKSRLPSSIYWPRRDGQKRDTVKVAYSDGRNYDFQEIFDISKDSYLRLEERKAKTREMNTKFASSKWWETLKNLVRKPQVAEDVKKILQNKADDPWAPKSSEQLAGIGTDFSNLTESNLKIVASSIEEFVNTKVDWVDILEPHGWTLLKTRDESRVWARPGRNERSAETDYNGGAGLASPAMSLLSSSEETGLSDLKEADIKLTKSRVMLRLHFNDDFPQYLSYVLRLKRDYDDQSIQ